LDKLFAKIQHQRANFVQLDDPEYYWSSQEIHAVDNALVTDAVFISSLITISKFNAKIIALVQNTN
jgi:hypothetical protein